MLKSDYKPGFRTKLYQKDLRIRTRPPPRTRSDPGHGDRHAAGERARGCGGADLDYSAIGTVLFKLGHA